MSVGYQYGQDTAEQSAFEHDFPYELTPDQSKSIDEIKARHGKSKTYGPSSLW